MRYLKSHLCIVAIYFPLSLSGQHTRLTDIETTGNGYKREHFSYSDTLLSEVTTYNKLDKVIRRVIFNFNESKVPVSVTVAEETQKQNWTIRYEEAQVAEISMADPNGPEGFVFSYDTKGELKSSRMLGLVKGTWEYSFEHGNLSSIFFNMPPDFPLTARNKTYTAYDNNMNFWNLTNKFMAKHKAILATFFGDDCWSLNNPVQYSMDHKDGERVTEFNYEYDGAGNPVRIVMKVTGEHDVVIKLTYAVR